MRKLLILVLVLGLTSPLVAAPGMHATCVISDDAPNAGTYVYENDAVKKKVVVTIVDKKTIRYRATVLDKKTGKTCEQKGVATSIERKVNGKVDDATAGGYVDKKANLSLNFDALSSAVVSLAQLDPKKPGPNCTWDQMEFLDRQ